MEQLDPQICSQARLSRDPRFDGEFFLAVTTTGIYCRPVCPARPPRESNVRYFRTAAEAKQEGFRPCLRCRPESAPLSPAWQGTATTVGRALQLINEGYLNSHSLSSLAERLGVGERYLRKLFDAQLGVSPKTVAQTQRLHFAQKLLLETTMPVTDIAFASGFGSVRRFNSATRETFGCAPGEMRRKQAPARRQAGIELDLSYRPPYDWDGVLGFFRRHAVDGLELVDDGSYQRNLATGSGPALIRVSRHPKKQALKLKLTMPDSRELMAVVATVRRMFDLDAQPEEIAENLSRDTALRPLLKKWPGIRSPVVPSHFESAVRGVLGQQVSIQAARRLCGELVKAAGNHLELDGEHFPVFPRPQQLAALPDTAFPMPRTRRNTLRAICDYFAGGAEGDMDSVLEELLALPGIGPWTTTMLAMRGYGDPDRFPVTDLGIIKAAQALKNLDKPELMQRIDSWRPWRSYAANLLWRTLSL